MFCKNKGGGVFSKNVYMKLNAVLLYITNVEKTIEFYQSLGFKIVEQDEDHVSATVGDFQLMMFDKTKVTFKGDSDIEPKGAGVFMYVEGDDVDKIHSKIVNNNLKPSSEPRDWPWGNREFAIKDPDGYKIVFYSTV